MRLPYIRRQTPGSKHGMLAADHYIGGIEHHAHHISSDRFNQADDFIGSDLLMSFHIEMQPQIKRNRLQLQQQPLRRFQLFLPGHIGAETVSGEHSLVGLGSAGGDP
ncbi:hypothetical protein D3C75_1105480 [compost metagenome]